MLIACVRRYAVRVVAARGKYSRLINSRRPEQRAAHDRTAHRASFHIENDRREKGEQHLNRNLFAKHSTSSNLVRGSITAVALPSFYPAVYVFVRFPRSIASLILSARRCLIAIMLFSRCRCTRAAHKYRCSTGTSVIRKRFILFLLSYSLSFPPFSPPPFYRNL